MGPPSNTSVKQNNSKKVTSARLVNKLPASYEALSSTRCSGGPPLRLWASLVSSTNSSGLFNDAVGVSHCIVISEQPTGRDVKGRGTSLISSRYSGMCLENITKYTKHINWYNRSASRGLNLEPPKYEEDCAHWTKRSGWHNCKRWQGVSTNCAVSYDRQYCIAGGQSPASIASDMPANSSFLQYTFLILSFNRRVFSALQNRERQWLLWMR
jgi:hypothetical protein